MNRSLPIAFALALGSCSDTSAPAGAPTLTERVAGFFHGDDTRSGTDRSDTATQTQVDRIAGLDQRTATGASRGLLRRLPADTLLVLRLPHLEQLSTAWERTAAAETLANHPMLGGADPIELVLNQLVTSAPMLTDLFELLPTLSGELVIALTGVDPAAPPGEMPVTAMLLLDVGAQSEQLQAALAPAVQMLSILPGFERTQGAWGVTGGDDEFWVNVTQTNGVFTAHVGSRRSLAKADQPTELPRARSFLASALVASTPDLAESGHPVVIETYLHLAPLWELARTKLPEQGLAPLRGTGLLRVAGASAALALDEDRLQERLTWCSPGRTDVISRALAGHPMNRELARLVPKSADSATILAIDLALVFNEVVALVPETARAAFVYQLAAIEESFGTDLHEDLFQNLGPTMLLMARGDPADWMETGEANLAAVLQLSDAAGAKRLVAAATRALAGQVEVKTEQRDGVEVTTFAVSSSAVPVPVRVSVAVADSFIAVATDDMLLSDVLAAAKSGTVTRNDFLTELEQAGDSAWCVAMGRTNGGELAMTAIGTADDDGLHLEAPAGSGSLLLGGLAGGLAIPAALAIPQLMSARLSANESAAISMLASLAAAERYAFEAAVLDADHDGKPEALLLHELTGQEPIRGLDERLEPAMISARWSEVGPGTGARSGYVFRIDLPAIGGGGTSVSHADGSDVSVDGAEQAFVAYAWPTRFGETGARVFALDQTGGIWFTDNHGRHQQYTGARGPAFDAFFTADKGADRNVPFTARDGGTWQRSH